MTEEGCRIETDCIIEIGLKGHHTEESQRLDKILEDEISEVEIE